MASAPRSDDPAGSADPAPVRVPQVRLRARIAALLASRLRRKAAAPRADGAGRQSSSWPDSFFDLPPDA